MRSIYITHSEEETEVIARELAREVKPGAIIGLVGDLGAGKTVFVRGFVTGLGGDRNQVHSPTFTLLNIYSGVIPIYHFDLYRLNNVEDLDAIGYYEFSRSGGVSLIEWIDKVIEIHPDVDIWVKISFVKEENERLLDIQKREV